MDSLDLYVGTFNLPCLFTLRFHPSSNQLTVVKTTKAIGPHSWLSLSADQRTLYATAWTQPGSIAAYRAPDLQLLNSRPVRNKPGYVTCSGSHVFSVGGPTGEVFRIQDDGGIGDLVQELDFAGQTNTTRDAHGDFGGLRHGAHGCDLSPDGKTLYVADIGRNCTWTFAVDGSNRHVLQDQQLHAAPRQDDGPRHAWPHPNGRILYVVQEHSSIVDVFRIDQGKHVHLQGASILPEGTDAGLYWADEVRLSTDPDSKYLFASTRGLETHTKGYVAAFELSPDGTIKDTLDIWETPTSGGIANAIEPAPRGVYLDSVHLDSVHLTDSVQNLTDSVQYLAMTDSEACKVFILAFDGKIRMVASVGLDAQPATAVWLRP